ncbi:hypothetical protein [Edaphobacillus lindanitolerans]|uniref:Uncharacterized protein n=1 Tax=Edaphobacillus lindanitolerans TaxID=550447 RepID=A0A1U7PQ14_9BACI|nr:hypothetical protein [Edaphobacillus lindanitolerans]SIT91483.1 hypothetical protein SAMN05428946_2689 [Edaphobacillus lindanitolerans]
MEDKKPGEELTYGVSPVRILNNTLAFIVVVFGLIGAALLFEGPYLIMFWMSIAIVCLAALVVSLHLRLKEVVSIGNENLSKMSKMEDNRNTLKAIVKERNREIDQLKRDVITTDAEKAILLHLYMENNHKPEKKVIEQALSIPNSEVESIDREDDV